MKWIVPLLLAASLLPQAASARNIFGADRRVDVKEIKFPLDKIGRLNVVSDRTRQMLSSCTASLVGRTTILTNSHCLDDFGRPGRAHEFALGYKNGAHVAISKIVKAEVTRNYGEWNDWAIAELAEPLGDLVGWFEIGDTKKYLIFDSLRFPLKVSMAGYPSDLNGSEEMVVENDCTIHFQVLINSALAHDCASYYGASGSPIFKVVGQKAYIFALNQGMYVPRGYDDNLLGNARFPRFNSQYANLAVDSRRFKRKIEARKGK